MSNLRTNQKAAKNWSLGRFFANWTVPLDLDNRAQPTSSSPDWPPDAHAHSIESEREFEIRVIDSYPPISDIAPTLILNSASRGCRSDDLHDIPPPQGLSPRQANVRDAQGHGRADDARDFVRS